MDYSSKEYFDKMTAWWRAANYLSVGQLYLKDNPLLRRTLKPEDVKKHPIGHWGTIPGQNFIYVHLNRVINKYDLNMFYIEGPGHGGQVMVSNAYLDGSYTEIYPEVTEDETGMQKLFKRFSFPGGIASHAAPETPGSIHEGGELGYSLSHAVGAVLDNPEVISAVVIGDGEAETGPLAGSWFSNVFINPVIDGAVLPILHLNGAKIANPTILARKSDGELANYFNGLGWEPFFIEGNDPEKLNPVMAEKMDQAIEKIKSIQKEARLKTATDVVMPKWPVLIVRTPKGWTGPKEWDGEPIEGTFRAHQVPIPVDQEHMDHADALLRWLKSYEPEKLFDAQGRILEEIREIAPTGDQRMAKNPITNGGIDPKPLIMPDWKKYTLQFEKTGSIKAEDMTELGKFVREIIEKNPENFRIFGPDETKSNRLNQVFKTTNRQWMEKIEPENDEWLSPSGRVIDSQLSEHQDEGFLEGYVLTGRHGFFASYESFLRVVDSMLTQHFKWMRKSHDLSWRNDYPSLNLIASSTVFQQDHNGYSHQDPGILTHLAEKKAEFIREYLPADANTLLAVMDKAFRSSEKINLIISSKHPRAQFYSAEEAAVLVNEGLKIIDWASTAKEEEPELVIAAAGTESNLEALAAATLLLEEFPKLKIRFINVVDLLKLRHPSQDPRGLSDEEFDQYFTKDKPILFAFHGYETLVRTIFFDRHNHHLMIHGYKENGDITTPFDMRVVNELDRYHLAKDAALKIKGSQAEDFAEKMDQKLQEHQNYIRENGIDLPEVLDWKWKNLDQ
ncbi:D-xylulose 5-phosphate/D-fructose 6-phosphate phosphoketolase [Enterococcus faecium]|uniref:phosphoketolase family protein n=1 Tax=Enterococcus faecium TaxID=1352 RepID=UPI00098CFE37|nr:phosphoketolase family protein [Enterococcus faecium]EHK4845046.1 phosphoketolase family protein [Enterococcus faecium]MBK4749642.1 D-xylulose 5-phosphate/D-fructose 6-phosphate phosphoketolase [Enterococcus faecium]MBK4754178.1 D-xylulose 5-phosphate/D-fructose 6-phosphate phosphoketolase [Enterococcus faecium]MBK4759629.1 D-xylulose 5-phosphate/D-fructose 6-phosphate phosphoketolase [Enterococcus faecium]MBK4792794.1 D-xylulose 5-phosphate/D-fructose 6-phosphate phosphoketolase [Enterococ